MAAGVPAATADEEEDWGSSAFGGAAVSELPNSDVADWGAFDEGGFESNAGAGADWGSFDDAPAVAGVAANDGQLAPMVPASDVEQLVQVSRACLFGQPSLLTSRCSRLGNQHSSLCAGSLQWSGGGARTASPGACGVCVPHIQALPSPVLNSIAVIVRTRKRLWAPETKERWRGAGAGVPSPENHSRASGRCPVPNTVFAAGSCGRERPPP